MFNKTQRGHYVDFTKLRNGNLKITLNREGRAELRSGAWESNPRTAFEDLIEPTMSNGWEHIKPEEIGPYSAAMMISDECERDASGGLIKCGYVYSNIDHYKTQSDIERLLRDGYVIWRGKKG